MRSLFVILLFSSAACSIQPLAFVCSTDPQCNGKPGGRCVSSRCAFPSAICPSGYVYEAAGALDGTCTPPDAPVDMASLDLDTQPSPTPQPIGAACHLDGDCDGGRCVDGVCCDSACTGACSTCNDGVHPGHCATAADGQPDPHHLCTSTDPCGFTGRCSRGACALQPKDTVCAPQSCAQGALTLTRRCDGAGTCVAGMTRQCDPYVCLADGSDCYATCSGSNTGCKAPNTCTTGSCGPAPLGAICTTGAACASGNCTDNRCCASASCATCYSCAVAGHEGSCFTIPARTADARCQTWSPTTCGYDGTCDGNGACGYYPVGTLCAWPYCSADKTQVYNIQEHCPGGGGSCPTGSPVVTLCGGGTSCVANAATMTAACQ